MLGEWTGPLGRRVSAVARASPSLTLVLLLGCGGHDGKPASVRAAASAPAEADAPEPDASPTAASSERGPSPASPADAPPPQTSPSPAYLRPGDIATGVDELVFWGWSADGRRFAFETFHYGAQMANCEGEAELTIVNAATDRYAHDGHVLVKHREPEAEVCDPPDLREELGFRRDPRLLREGISAKGGDGPIAIEREGKSDRYRFALPERAGGGVASLSFRVLHDSDDPMEAADGAAYELRMTLPGASPQGAEGDEGGETVIERGRRRRPWVLRYSLDQGMVFIGPEGRYAAILVAVHEVMPEGVRTTWMANGVALR